MRCWAFSPDGHRCNLEHEEHVIDKDSGEVMHLYTVTWLDSEVVSPTGGTTTPVPVLTPAGVSLVADMADAVPTGCFACSCSESEHGETGCEKHGCYTFIPA